MSKNVIIIQVTLLCVVLIGVFAFWFWGGNINFFQTSNTSTNSLSQSSISSSISLTSVESGNSVNSDSPATPIIGDGVLSDSGMNFSVEYDKTKWTELATGDTYTLIYTEGDSVGLTVYFTVASDTSAATAMQQVKDIYSTSLLTIDSEGSKTFTPGTAQYLQTSVAGRTEGEKLTNINYFWDLPNNKTLVANVTYVKSMEGVDAKISDILNALKLSK